VSKLTGALLPQRPAADSPSRPPSCTSVATIYRAHPRRLNDHCGANCRTLLTARVHHVGPDPDPPFLSNEGLRAEAATGALLGVQLRAGMAGGARRAISSSQ